MINAHVLRSQYLNTPSEICGRLGLCIFTCRSQLIDITYNGDLALRSAEDSDGKLLRVTTRTHSQNEKEAQNIVGLLDY